MCSLGNYNCPTIGEKLVDGKLTVLEHSNDVWIRHSYDADEEPQCVSYSKK